MGYLNNSEITIDAILTRKGREKLASGRALAITKFALADDEIDYGLYEPAHPLGSAYYDSAIRATPITEAISDETQALRWKLLTMTNRPTKIPVVNIGYNAIIVNIDAPADVTITPTTTPDNFNRTLGYTAVLADSRIGTIVATAGTSTATAPTFFGDNVWAVSSVAVGTAFQFKVNPSLTNWSQISGSISTTLTIYGNETGGSITIPVFIEGFGNDPDGGA
jgi:hypothetical protein